MPCKQYFLNYFGRNKGYHGLLQLFWVKFIFLDKAVNSGKKCENSWFSLFFVWTNKNPKCGCKMIVRTIVKICAKLLISQLKIGGAMAISLVAMATATLILFLDVVLELIEARISFYMFFWFSCRQFLFTKPVFREIRRKYLIWNNDVIVLMTSWNVWRHSTGMSLIYVMSFWKLFYSQLEISICFSINLSSIKMLSTAETNVLWRHNHVISSFMLHRMYYSTSLMLRKCNWTWFAPLYLVKSVLTISKQVIPKYHLLWRHYEVTAN